MDIINTYKIKNEKDTREFGLKLADSLLPGDVLALIGDFGTGKTTLTRYIAEGLGIKARVNSPTFTIVKEYHEGRLPLYHFDVYRLEGNIDELYNIGADEYFYGKGISIVEWADMIYDELPKNTKYIFIEYTDLEGERIYKCTF